MVDDVVDQGRGRVKAETEPAISGRGVEAEGLVWVDPIKHPGQRREPRAEGNAVRGAVLHQGRVRPPTAEGPRGRQNRERVEVFPLTIDLLFRLGTTF